MTTTPEEDINRLKHNVAMAKRNLLHARINSGVSIVLAIWFLTLLLAKGCEA